MPRKKKYQSITKNTSDEEAQIETLWLIKLWASLVQGLTFYRSGTDKIYRSIIREQTNSTNNEINKSERKKNNKKNPVRGLNRT